VKLHQVPSYIGLLHGNRKEDNRFMNVWYSTW